MSYFSSYRLKEDESGELLHDKLQFIFLELAVNGTFYRADFVADRTFSRADSRSGLKWDIG